MRPTKQKMTAKFFGSELIKSLKNWYFSLLNFNLFIAYVTDIQFEFGFHDSNPYPNQNKVWVKLVDPNATPIQLDQPIFENSGYIQIP